MSCSTTAPSSITRFACIGRNSNARIALALELDGIEVVRPTAEPEEPHFLLALGMAGALVIVDSVVIVNDCSPSFIDAHRMSGLKQLPNVGLWR